MVRYGSLDIADPDQILFLELLVFSFESNDMSASIAVADAVLLAKISPSLSTIVIPMTECREDNVLCPWFVFDRGIKRL